MLRSGSSYLSQSELVLTFGLGAQTKADSVEIQWPSGQVDKLPNVNAGQTITVQEGKGVMQTARMASAMNYEPQGHEVSRRSPNDPSFPWCAFVPFVVKFLIG